MNQKLDKAKAICTAYKNGLTVAQIARAFDNEYDNILGYLRRYFEHFYGEPFVSYSEKKKDRIAKIYEDYKSVYVKGLFTRTQLCKILDCNVNELESMFRKYKIKNQWLKTYESQITLCNTSLEFRESIKEFAEKYGYKSVREVAVQAINEFMLQEKLRRD